MSSPLSQKATVLGAATCIRSGKRMLAHVSFAQPRKPLALAAAFLGGDWKCQALDALALAAALDTDRW